MLPAEMKKIEQTRFGEERALYGSRGVWLRDCAFDGEEDGESALKESSDILAEDTLCNLRYPFWHDRRLTLRRCEMTPLCRAALWYSEEVTAEDCRLHGIKALRECRKVTLRGCDIRSPEFGWSTEGLTLEDSTAEGEYFLMRVSNFSMRNTHFTGKYSFQYAENGVIEHCELNTKDAFWHAKNLTVRDSVIRGEYLAWYSEGLTLENCTLIGTQPLCYCKDLRLINCKMTDADLAFEKSEVHATLTAPVISIKNPRAGEIRLPELGELIMDDCEAEAKILLI